MKIEQIIKEFKEAHGLSSPAEMRLLSIMEDNLKLIESCNENLKNDELTTGLPFGLITGNGTTYEHPSLKIKKEAEKAIMSCLRLVDLKTGKSVEKSKDEKVPKALHKIFKAI